VDLVGEGCKCLEILWGVRNWGRSEGLDLERRALDLVVWYTGSTKVVNTMLSSKS